MKQHTIKRDERILDFLVTRHTRIDDPIVCWIEAHASAHYPTKVEISVTPSMTPGEPTFLRCSVCGNECRTRKKGAP